MSKELFEKIKEFAMKECLSQYGIADVTHHSRKDDLIINTGKERDIIIRIGLVQ